MIFRATHTKFSFLRKRAFKKEPKTIPTTKTPYYLFKRQFILNKRKFEKNGSNIFLMKNNILLPVQYVFDLNRLVKKTVREWSTRTPASYIIGDHLQWECWIYQDYLNRLHLLPGTIFFTFFVLKLCRSGQKPSLQSLIHNLSYDSR